MARIRTIKPEFWSDEKIVGLPFSARLFFIGLWNFADDFGALPDKPDQLKMLVLPAEERIDVHQMVDLLIACDLLERYVDFENDNTFLLIKNWHLHQKVDKPTKSRIITVGSKKSVISQQLRRNVAERYGCTPGETVNNECYFCGAKGNINWTKRRDGSPSGWVQFSHELSHIISEFTGGETKEENIVLACRNCNRSMGVKNAFEWLFTSKYSSNQRSRVIEDFRTNSREFEKSIETSRRKGMEGKGMEGKGEVSPPAEKKEDVLKNSNLFRQPNIPKKEEVHRVFLQNGGNFEMAKKFFEVNDATGWFYKGSPITNFASQVPSYISSWNENNKKNGSSKINGNGHGQSAGAITLAHKLAKNIKDSNT
jgi:5-methylcytosine-specific restriction endonuclease McrA